MMRWCAISTPPIRSHPAGAPAPRCGVGRLTAVPICEADPWRMQYFEGVACPDDVRISTEDADSWEWFPAQRWIYDKLAVALSQGLDAAPHGVMPRAFPVFSKPIMNLRGMGTGSRVIESAADYKAALTPGISGVRC